MTEQTTASRSMTEAVSEKSKRHLRNVSDTPDKETLHSEEGLVKKLYSHCQKGKHKFCTAG